MVSLGIGLILALIGPGCARRMYDSQSRELVFASCCYSKVGQFHSVHFASVHSYVSKYPDSDAAEMLERMIFVCVNSSMGECFQEKSSWRWNEQASG